MDYPKVSVHYEVQVKYKPPEQGNWTGIEPGWKVVGEQEKKADAIQSQKFYKDNTNQTVYSDVRVIRVDVYKEVMV